MSGSVVDSVMGHMKDLLQELTDEANEIDQHWIALSREINEERHPLHQMFEPTEQEERAAADKERRCDELYDRAKTIRECRNAVARHVAEIIDENIEIQFSKWNMK